MACPDDVGLTLVRDGCPYPILPCLLAVTQVYSQYPGSRQVEICHYLGGPCSDESIATCIVLGGTSCGWTIHTTLREAVRVAYARAARRSPDQVGLVPLHRLTPPPPPPLSFPVGNVQSTLCYMVG